MSDEEAVYALELTPDEISDLQSGVEILVDVPGQFIENDPTISVRCVKARECRSE